jgi:hypothetical protein
VHDIAATPRIVIYPNPVNDELMIETETAPKGEASIVITSVTGQQVISLESDEAKTSIPCEDLASGVYFVSYQVNGVKTLRKFVKM